MPIQPTPNWCQNSQQDLWQGITEVYQALQLQIQSVTTNSDIAETHPTAIQPVVATEEKSLSALTALCKKFQLSPFERKIILLCAGMELHADFSGLCAKLQGEVSLNYPTLNLASTLFAEDAYWQVLMPQAPLRHWQFIELADGVSLNNRQLRINERILNYLLGNLNNIDERLTALLIPVQTSNETIITSHQVLIDQIIQVWQQATSNIPTTPLHISCHDRASRRSVALAASKQWGSPLYRIEVQTLPTDLQEWAKLQQLLVREALLNDCVYLLEYDSQVDEKPIYQYLLVNLIEALPANCILAGQAQPNWLNQAVINLEIKRPTQQEQLLLWQTTLANFNSLDQSILEHLVAQFNFNANQINSIVSACYQQLNTTPTEAYHALWQQCRQQTRQSLNGLIHIIEPKVSWKDITLAEAQLQVMHDIVRQVTHRRKVYQQWGFAEKGTRGLGICALFAGPSGTGKTLAAEVIAQALKLDIYRIDLSAVISKYIGETEKQLKRIFDMAETSGAVLLFDEADALFGKRSEIYGSQDRYANMEINYLLQRIEAYQGLSILTTNFKDALDQAFMRRIRFIVQFQYPSQAQRIQIWQQVFPKQTPLQNLDMEKLSRLTLTGSHIHNIALNAAFLAAEQNQEINMSHLLRAAQSENLKLDMPSFANEVKDWV